MCCVCDLQSGLGVQDLGQFYHTPVKDANGSIVLTTINYITDPKTVNSTHAKWVSLGKVQRRVCGVDLESLPAPEILLNSVTVSST